MNRYYPNGQYPYYGYPYMQGLQYGAPTATAPQAGQAAVNGGTATTQSASWTQGWFSVSDPQYLKGAVLGAAVSLVLTNPKVQRAVVKGVVTLWSSVQGGFEEMKEQIQDIKSEMSMHDDGASE